jgi:hypothetical protein
MIPIDMRTEPGFKKLLEPLNLTGLENHRGTVFGIWEDRRLAYFNPWWYRFARENDGEDAIILDWNLGRSVMDSVPGSLKEFYENLYRSVFEKDPTSGPQVRHEYECSSPDIFRRYLMTLYRLGEAEGILVVNSLVVEEPHDPGTRPSHEPLPAAYVDENGFIHQCAGCRRVMNLKEEDRWDWVPAWVAKPPLRTSHTLCSTCLPFFR